MRLIIILSALVAIPAYATDEPEHPVPAPQEQQQAQEQLQGQEQGQEQGQQQSASSNQSQSQGNVQTIESERQAPSTFISAPGSTAPCVIANGWSVGVPGAGGGRTRAKVDAACWAEYVKQAEHDRRMDEARLQLQREQLQFESQRLEQCSEIGNRVLEACVSK